MASCSDLGHAGDGGGPERWVPVSVLLPPSMHMGQTLVSGLQSLLGVTGGAPLNNFAALGILCF